ncbi:hypothetical protein MYX65_03715 [Acidobacteria bacterium AH-259-L09]|nr:hypothetical protein [Acidobacteria bacterium AH-259-L09]
MKRKLLWSLLLVVLISNITCLGKRMNKIMDSWMSHSYSDLVSEWGPPSQVLDIGATGNKIVVYLYNEETLIYPGTATAVTTGTTTNVTYRPPIKLKWTKYRMFWINSDGIIYRWAWKGW